MDADRGVGRAGAAGNKSDARLAGQLAVGVGHVGDAAFLPADDEFELILALVDGVEYREVRLAGYAEAKAGAVGDQ